METEKNNLAVVGIMHCYCLLVCYKYKRPEL